MATNSDSMKGKGKVPDVVTEKVGPILEHVKRCLDRHRAVGASNTGTKAIPPLFVAFQGPQGSGKTFLTSHLHKLLASPPYNLSVAVLSIDDLYLPHSGLLHVAKENGGNKLLAGRGLPGTHDVELGTEVLRRLKVINEPKEEGVCHGGEGVRLPVFEKSLHNGEGDRLPPDSSPLIHPSLDILLFEGWCVGFCPINNSEIKKRREDCIPDLEGILDLRKTFKEEDLLVVNEKLWKYVRWWEFFDVFIQVKPPDATPYSLIYKWRLQQEHNMKAKNGGKGMTDEQVKTFVDRYIPGYVFFSDGIQHGYISPSSPSSSGDPGPGPENRQLPRWLGNGLKVEIDEERKLVRVDEF